MASPKPFLALVAALPLALTLCAGHAMARQDPPANPIDRAERFLAQNKPIAARMAIAEALESNATTIAQRSRAVSLLAEANRRANLLDSREAALQRAEAALEIGDVRTAERQASIVLKNATANTLQTERAQRLLASASARRAELAPIVGETLVQAERDFLAGRFDEARRGLSLVDRSGVTLTPAQQKTLDTYQLALVDRATEAPDARFAEMQPPGTVRRREEQPAQPEPAAQPPAQPAAQPEPVAAQPPPTPPPSGDDLIRQSQQAAAMSLMGEADSAFDAKRYNEAAGKYYRLRTEFAAYLSPEQVAKATQRENDSRTLMNSVRAAQPEDLLREREVLRQQSVAEFNNDMGQAKRALDTGDTNQARTLVARARLTINNNRKVFAESEFENFDKQASDMLATIDKDEQAQMKRRAEERDREAQRAAERNERVQREERERKIVELIDRARAYQSEMRYHEGLQAVKQLLFIDPINPTGLLLQDLFTDIIIFQRAQEAYRKKQIGVADLDADIQEASTPSAKVLQFPDDWQALSASRGEAAAYSESAENRRVLADLGAKRVPSVSFQDHALGDVIQFVQTITQTNLDVDWASLELAGIQKETTVSLNLTNVTYKTLLDRITEKVSGQDKSSRADWAVIDGVVTIASEDRIRRNTALVVYDIKDLIIETPDYRDVPRIDLQQALQSAQGGSGQSPFRQEQQRNDEQLTRDREERMDALIDIITQHVDQEGWEANGGTPGKITKMVSAGNLIILNTPKNHRAIMGLLAKLREQRAMQINVETRFLLVNSDYFEQIGFDLDVYFNANNNQVRAARAIDPTIQARDFFQFDPRRTQIGAPVNGLGRNVTGATTATTQVIINPQTGLPQTVATTQFANQGVINPRSWSPIGVEQDSLGLASTLAPSSDWSNAILGASPALGIAGQFLDDIQVDFLVQATQADRRSIQLTAPRLTFTNGQTSNIYVASQTAFVSDLQPVVGDSAVGFDPTIATVTEGVTMLVTGTVSADRRYVTLDVDAGVARLDGFGQQAITAVAGGQLVNSATAQAFVQLPTVTVTRVRTTVTVPDQGTIMLGGQRLVTEFEVETGVPVLSKLPILNRFFTNRIESKEENTLLILLKPTILIQNEEEERNFPGLLDSLRSGLGG
ncbi:MAG: hypothetical protein JNM80_10890 [Phycisphaerae bacterium]|nr:hypothetical protein [Phycisphaerae bacterium]